MTDKKPVDEVLFSTSNIDFEKYLLDQGLDTADSLRSADTFLDELLDYAANGDKMVGSTLPWAKTHHITRLQEGQLSIWAGESGSGKSLLLGQVLNHVMFNYQKRICIASMEMKPRQTLYRMICQTVGHKADGELCQTYIEGVSDRLIIYDQLSSVNVQRILGMCYYAAKLLKSDHIVIDSLTKCGLKRDDYAAQARFVDDLQWCAKALNIHIHLVCHMTKGGNGGRSAIRGAGEITDLADNVFIVGRNREKDSEIEKLQIEGHCDNEVLNQPCAFLRVDKNREYGRETDFGLYLDKASGAYTDEWVDVIPKGVEEMIMRKK